MQTTFTPNVIPNKHTANLKSNRTRNDQVKSKVVISVFPLSLNKKKIYFFTANTKHISSRVVKISAFSLVVRTREKY